MEYLWSVMEDAPRDGSFILLWFGFEDGRMHVGSWVDGRWTVHGLNDCDPLCWRPLPSGPSINTVKRSRGEA